VAGDFANSNSRFTIKISSEWTGFSPSNICPRARRVPVPELMFSLESLSPCLSNLLKPISNVDPRFAVAASLGVVGFHTAWKIANYAVETNEIHYTRVTPFTAVFGLRTWYKELFDFYCEHYCNFRARLTEVEMEYVNFCLQRAPREYWVGSILNMLAEKFSWLAPKRLTLQSHLTFSHCCKNGNVDSTRLALGVPTAREFGELRAFTNKCQKIFSEKGIDVSSYLQPQYSMRLSGLGWCLKDDGFKIYLLYDSIGIIHPDFKDLLNLYPVGDLSQYKDNGLVSLTYKENKLVEHKLYLYKEDELEARNPGSEHTFYGDVIMLSSTRVCVTQECYFGPDPEKPTLPLRFRKIEEKLNTAGQIIAWKNEAYGYTLDTWSGSDKDNWTTYFPH
jgi:hypothetical protein